MAKLTPLTGQNLSDRLEVRVNEVYGSSSALYLQEINEAMRTICQIGSLTFLMKEAYVTAHVNGSTPPELRPCGAGYAIAKHYVTWAELASGTGALGDPDIDLGKKVSAYSGGHRLIYIPYHKMIEESVSYGNAYEHQTAFTYDASYFYVNQDADVYVTYQALPDQVEAATTGMLPEIWTTLLLDVSEYHIKVKNRMTNWEEARMRVVERMKIFARTFAIDVEEINIEDLFISQGK